MDISGQLDILRRGTVEIISEGELKAKLEKSQKMKKPLRVKMGFDPTAPDLHLGHYVGLRKLKDFQELGHDILFLIGDFTGRIGDPTGKNKTRPPLSEDDVKKNARTYEEQVFKILDPQKTKVLFNSEWCGSMKASELVQLAAQMNVARMLEREDFKARYTSGQSIAIHEFLYPLIQGFDSVAMNADIELGGQDQRFNLLVGRDLQKHFGQESQVLVLLPLIEGTDGVDKMSKSLGNSIGIAENSKDMFGKLMSIPDALMKKYFENLTRIDQKTVSDLLAGHPRDAKLRLASEIVSQFHGAEIAAKERQAFIDQFSKGKLPENIPEVSFNADWMNLPKLLSSAFPISTSEAKRDVSAGSCTLISGADSKKLDIDFQVSGLKNGDVIRLGKLRYVKIKKD